MQIAPRLDAPRRPPDLPTALREAAAMLGQQPAVTVLRGDRREEQGMASLAQWAAKGAHLLQLDLLLEPGDRLALRAPPGWGAAAVALAAWWVGVTVTLDDDAEVAVVHELAEPPSRAVGVLVLGDAVDGAPVTHVEAEPWVRAVQAYPDQPPEPAGSGEADALAADGRVRTQGELIAGVADEGASGTLGLDAAAAEPAAALVDVAVRPLLVGRPTVVLAGASRADAEGEKVALWR